MWVASTSITFGTETILGEDSSLRDLFLRTRPLTNQEPQAQATSRDQIALGYTLFLRDASGQPVPVSPSWKFKEGDSVRMLVESNSDGHLHIFNRESKVPLRMIFPDLRIRRGDSKILAHLPLGIPPATALSSADVGWFTFSGPPQPESLYLVYAQRPVEGWPQGEELLKYPGGLQLSWDQFLQRVETKVQKIRGALSAEENHPPSTSWEESLSRKLILSKSDPPPSVVLLSPSHAQQLVIEIEFARR